MCMFCRSLFVLLYFFLLDIVLTVLLQYTDSDYPFVIFKLFLLYLEIQMYQNVKFNNVQVKVGAKFAFMTL